MKNDVDPTGYLVTDSRLPKIAFDEFNFASAIGEVFPMARDEIVDDSN
jgi:hypothetical protein